MAPFADYCGTKREESKFEKEGLFGEETLFGEEALCDEEMLCFEEALFGEDALSGEDAPFERGAFFLHPAQKLEKVGTNHVILTQLLLRLT